MTPLGGWNYRVLRHCDKNPDGTEHIWFAVHEVYYTETGKPTSCTEQPSFVFGETLLEAQLDTQRMLEAFKKPALDYEAIGSNIGEVSADWNPEE